MRIVISGTVGIGKSTTSEMVVKKLKEKGYDVNFLNEETVDSVYLDFYYKEPQNWAFISQIDFLLGRFKQWLNDEKSREQNNSDKRITLYDRHFLDDYVFAELHTIKENISMFNSLTYQAIYKELTEKMQRLDARPDYFFLLEAPLDVIIKRLEGRGRTEEQNVNIEYWKDLYHNYYVRPMFKNHFQNNVKNFVKIETSNKVPEEISDEILKIIGI